MSTARLGESMIGMIWHQRVALRRGRAVTTREAQLAARWARLDYKTSGESGAMRVPTRPGKWPIGSRPPAAETGRHGPVRTFPYQEIGESGRTWPVSQPDARPHPGHNGV